MNKANEMYRIAVLLSFCSIALSQRGPFIPTPPPPLVEIPLSERQFRVVYEWRTVDFAYRAEEHRTRAMQNGEYNPRNVLISDVKAYANRLYLSLPRMLPGVPATLGWIVAPENNGPTNPRVEPFPSWDMNVKGNCSALQFVQALAVDRDGVMWVADSGRIDTLRPERSQFNCIPKLLLLDLKRNGTIIHRYEFPEDVVARGTNYLNKLVIDDAYGGYAYITDNSGTDPGIVVFSRKLNRSWKLREESSMRAQGNALQFAVNGTNLEFSIHIDGIALGPYYNPRAGPTSAPAASQRFADENYERNVYYSPLSSYHLYSVPASILRDPDFSRRSSPRDVLESITDYGLKMSQTDGMIMDNKGILYYGLLKEHAIAQWDSLTPFTINNQHIVAKDDDFIQWIDGMSFDEEGSLYVVINRLHNFVAGRLNPNEVNFRILKARTGSLSYVYTTGFGPGNVNYDVGNFPHEGVFFDTNSISSTTPFFNSLEGRNPYYRGNANTPVGLPLYMNMILGIIIAYILQ